MRFYRREVAAAIFLLMLVAVVPSTHWGSQSESEQAGLTTGTSTMAAASATDSINRMPIVVGDGEVVTGIDFALHACGSISGTVTDFATGVGIMDVLVSHRN